MDNSNTHVDAVIQLYAEQRNESENFEQLNSETQAMIDKGLNMVTDILVNNISDSTEMAEEERILVFQASITSWCRKNSSQGIHDFSIYDFLNRDQSSGVVTIHFLRTTRSTPIILTEWDVMLLTAYFKSVRPAFIHRSTYPSEPSLLVSKEFNEFTSCFFVNSTGKDDFKAGNIVLRFVEKIIERTKSSVEYISGTVSTDYQLPAMCEIRR